MNRLRKGAHAMALLVLAATTPAWADDFYKGRTITMVVGFTPGGGFDTNGRMLARHITHHIPGRPDMVVSNMVGAASFTAVQYLETRAPKDGTAIVTFNFGLIGDSKVFPERVKLDFRSFAWIGSISADVTVCYLWSALGVRTLDEARALPVVHMGNDGVGTSAYLVQNLFKNIFGVKVQQVQGYPGTAEVRLAIERGELDGDCGAWSSIPESWIKAGKITPMLRTSPVLPDDMPRDTPYAVDIAPDETSRNVIRLLTASGRLGRPFIASEATPANRVAILQRAFDETMTDPEFLADAAKLRQPVSPVSGKDAQQILQTIYNAPPAIVSRARSMAGG